MREIFDGQRFDRVGDGHAGVVDHEVDLALARFCDQENSGGDLFAVGYVDDDG